MLRHCDPPAEPTAAQQDRIFRFGAIVKAELEKSGQSLVLMSRSGLALGRFGQRYSHAGFSLKASGNEVAIESIELAHEGLEVQNE